jgi:hypothetical protein
MDWRGVGGQAAIRFAVDPHFVSRLMNRRAN